MEIRHLRLASFRAHADSVLHFGPKINLLYGPNGAGKTNVLEAIYYLSLSKSFLASSDQYVLKKGHSFFEVEASFAGAHRKELSVRLAYVPEEGKRMFVNKAQLDKLAQIVGVIPVVVFAPSDHALTAEGPEVRRRFMDTILSQARPVYLDDLLSYRRVLKQRNVLLMQYRRSRGVPRDVLASWDAELIRLGSRIVTSRIQFVQIFSSHLQEAYELIAEVGEMPRVEYQTFATFGPGENEDAVAQAFQRKLAGVARRELDTGRSLVGPHRDELVFRLNDLEVRRYASQGQHQTFGMALKLAQFFYLQAQLDEQPILLLDDLFGNLDARRTRVFLDMLQTDTVGQCLITAAQPEPFYEAVHFDGDVNRAILIENGNVVEKTV